MIDEKKQPVPFASVFLDNTTIGVSSGEDGSFEIKNIPNGKYDFNVSAIGFKRFHHSIEFLSANRVIEVQLLQDPVMLSEVVIRPQDVARNRLGQFKKLFLGTTDNASRCNIINPEDLNIYYDKSSKILTVQAIKPIVIENKALGYRLSYTLDFFEYNETNSIRKFRGAERFEDMGLTNPRDSSKYNKKRQDAYRGSLRHFMVALYNNKFTEEGFVVSLSDSSQLKDTGSIEAKPLDLQKFLTGTTVKKFNFSGILRVLYGGEPQEWSYNRSRGALPQVSYLVFFEPISIFENGYHYDPLSIYTNGYLAWSEVIAESIPLDFKPSKK